MSLNILHSVCGHGGLCRTALVASRCFVGEDRLVCVQAVRWRKRRWAPVSDSKLFYVRTPPVRDPVEMAELVTRQNNYRTVIRSLRAFISKQETEKLQASHDQHSVDRQTKAQEESIEINADWNATSAQLRETRVRVEEKLRDETQLEQLMQLEKGEEARLQAANLFIRREKESLQQMISQEKLEQGIEAALDSPQTHNFVLDREGTILTEELDGTLSQESVESQIERLSLEQQQAKSPH